MRAPAYGVWAADIDTDGDLDFVLAPRDSAAVVLRNNADGTFTPRDVFPGATRVRGFAWADFDGEGVPDAALLDEAGVVHVLLNQRGGSFRAEALPGARCRRLPSRRLQSAARSASPCCRATGQLLSLRAGRLALGRVCAFCRHQCLH